MKDKKKQWYCYLLYNLKRTYVGISTDPWRRLKEHNSGKLPGAKSTRDGGYFILWYISNLANRSIASKVEFQLKLARGLMRRWKKLKELRKQYGLYVINTE
jgi:putative endonuclease